jgi:hypothetical protein
MCPASGDRPGADEPDQHVAAARHRQPRRQTGPRPPRQRERDIGEHFGQRRGAAGERRGQPVDLLGERGLPAARVDALKAAYVHDDLHRALAEREIGELALVAGVNPGRATLAARARRIAGLPAHAKHHQIAALLDAVHRGSSELRQNASMPCDAHAGHPGRPLPTFHVRHAGQRTSRDSQSGGEEHLNSGEVEVRPSVPVPFEPLDARDVALNGA